MVNRKYCVRGYSYKKGQVQTVDEYGRSSYRSVRDKDIAYRDGPISHCFIEKKCDIDLNEYPCFDEGRMWCRPNDCSVFECNRLWWSKIIRIY